MPEAAKGPAGPTPPAERLEGIIERWKRLAQRAKDLKDRANITIPPYDEAFEELVDRREEARDRVIDFVERHPKLREKAVALGFKADLLPGVEGEGWEQTRPPGSNSSGTGAQGEQSGSGDSSLDAATERQNEVKEGLGGTQRDDGPPPNGNRLLPGVKGQDFYVGILAGGDRLAIYHIKVGNNVVQLAVRIEKDKLARYGIGENDGRRLTAAQAKKIEEIGFAEELQPFFRGEDKNPFRALSRMVRRSYQGTELLEEDEVLGLILAQHVFGWSDAEFQNQLRMSEWYGSTNEYQRHWKLEMKKGDRQAAIQETREKVYDALETMYGRDWVTHIKGGVKTAQQWAKDIASGRWGTSGNPERGFAYWASQQEDRARKIEGTPAFIANAQDLEAQRRYMNRPEDMYEQIRAQAIQALGYRGLPDDSTLRHWAKRLAYATGERGSEGDWARYLRRQKKALYPYLDDDENWMDRAAAYKRAAEEEYGQILSWEDPLLHDFTARDDTGKRIRDEAMSLHDFTLKVRKDNRYATSQPAIASAQSFANGLVGLFGGPGSGGGLAA